MQHVNRYISFSEMLKAESLSNVLPGVETIEEGNGLTSSSISAAKIVFSIVIHNITGF